MEKDIPQSAYPIEHTRGPGVPGLELPDPIESRKQFLETLQNLEADAEEGFPLRPRRDDDGSIDEPRCNAREGYEVQLARTNTRYRELLVRRVDGTWRATEFEVGGM